MDQSRGIEKTFADFVESVASKAGLKIVKKDANVAVAAFRMAEGRSQTVWIKPVGFDVHRNLIVAISSPALKMPKGQMIGQQKANDLLRENAKMAHGAWAIEDVDGDGYLVALDTQIAATMQPEEFEASVRGVAATADQMERKLGVDVF